MDEKRILDGIDKDCAIVLNLDEKLTALAEDVNIENIASLVCRTLISLIGEDSNAATCYHNKAYTNEDVKRKYDKYVDILSIVNSFAIDFAKTGYIMQIPYHIAKYSKPYPYFMRYISDYYEKMYKSTLKTNSTYKFQKSMRSNMNRLSFFIERFHDREIKWSRVDNFDHAIMIDETIEVCDKTFEKIEEIYMKFNREIKYLVAFENKLHRYDEFKSELKAWDKDSALNYHVNWDNVYDGFRKECEVICPNKKELANIAVTLCYEKYKKRGKKFLWAVASAGILDNIEQKKIMLPIKSEDGDCEYLGKKYKLVEYPMQEMYVAVR